MAIPVGGRDATDARILLREVLEPAQVCTAAADDAVDGVVPQAVAVPASAEEVARIVGVATEQRLALIAVGGRTLIATGNRPRAFDVAVSTERFDRAPELRADDMTVAVEAGVTLARLNTALAEASQRVALDTACPERATIGGLVAANATGGLAYGFGLPRDLVLGMTVVDGRGRTLRLGGRVVKNVAGYDLVRLFAGSFSTLGIFTSVVLRTHPRPERSGVLAFRFAEATALDEARARIFSSALPLAALDLSSGADGSWVLSARVEGTEREWTYQNEQIAACCGRGSPMEPASLAEPWVSESVPRAAETLVVRFAARPTASVELAARLLDTVRSAVRPRVFGRLGDGSVRAGWALADPERCYAIVGSLSALADERSLPMVVECAPPEVKSRLDVWGAAGPTVALTRRIKQSFDPMGVLAPGRFVGRL